ncbi:integrase [Polymorphobacter glacialis]|uniref:Integrase n=1 Tax=Sandarakinorhabdus glacialis TaxID=1614636 RepID=A0A916ZN41_9SPHN|nr:site-specific integrase [Polymorphobacter glacialis]GGE05607.1 integrase [Polymorphobacter glacialis]
MSNSILQAIAIPKLRKVPGRHADGGGLYLEVGESGSASWLVRMQKAGKRRDFGLGSLDKLSLADARKARDVVRGQFEAGLDPVAERKKADGVPTFRVAAATVHKAQKRAWSEGKHSTQWIRTLETYAYPVIGDLPVNKIDRREILDVLLPIWIDKNETARRVRQRIGAVLDWAYVKGHRESEAPLRALSKGLPRVTAERGHFEAMPFADVAPFIARLRDGESIGRLALETMILTAARGGEVRGAVWDELDLDAGLWSIPAERMKRNKPHVIPLSPAAVAVFKRALALRTDDAALVFPGLKSGKPLSDATMGKVLRVMGETAKPHGFRSSFKDWCGEVAGFPNELSEAALAHAIGNKSDAAYRRGTLLDRRRVMMNAWADYCDGGRGVALKVVAA